MKTGFIVWVYMLCLSTLTAKAQSSTNSFATGTPADEAAIRAIVVSQSAAQEDPHVAPAPSFSCAHVTSQGNRLICSTPRLAQLDRELALIFNNMQGQPFDHNKLRTDEDAWLDALHRDCSDVVCIEARYQTRLQMLRDISLRAASPVAYDETRPFTVPDDLRLRAERSIGQPCTTRAGLVDADIPGFLPAPRFQPILGQDFVVVVRQTGEHNFAFLLTWTPGDECLVHDSVAIHSNTVAGTFLQCSNHDPQLSGFGVRNGPKRSLVAFWTVNTDQLRLERIAIRVLGIEQLI